MNRNRLLGLIDLAEDHESFQVLRKDLETFSADADRLADECKGLILRIKQRLAEKTTGDPAKALMVLERAVESLGEAGDYLSSAAAGAQAPPPKPKGPENPRLRRPWLNGPHRSPFVTSPGTGFNSS